MTFLLVVCSTTRSIIFRIPEPFAMPVGFREITSHHKVLLAECIPYMTCNVLSWIVLESSVCNREISIFCIIHTETIVMLGCENHVFHTGFFHDTCPLVRIEISRIEFINQTEVPLLVVVITIHRTNNPVFRANIPRLYNTRNRIKSPMEQYPELLVLPLIQFFQNAFVCWPLIAIRLSVNKTVLGLCVQVQGHA